MSNQPGLCLGWYGHLMVFWNTKWQIKFLKRFLKCNWVTGSPPKFDKSLASWYPTYILVHAKFHNQPFIMRRAIWRHVFGQTNSSTHSHTIKPPTAGVRQLGHTSIITRLNQASSPVSMCSKCQSGTTVLSIIWLHFLAVHVPL